MRRSLALLCVVLPALGLADDFDIPATRMATPPKIDGKVTDEEWGNLPKGSGFLDSETGQPAEGGTFWVGYDDKFIYFAGRMDSKNPSALKATEYRSNVSLQSDDALYFLVDVFGSLSNFNIFGVNPRGATNIRIAGGRAAKREWLGDFQGGGRITETGYEVEARIPWGVMRLPEPGKRDVRIQFVRYNAQTQRDTEWRFLNQDFRLLPNWKGVDVPASGNQRSLKLLPYAYGGFDKDRHIANAGLDLKTSLSDRIDLVGTINPDFRNIENQILSIDFSRFERLAGESRPFFLEGGEYYRTSLDAPIFASQRIGQFDAGFKTFGQLTDKTDFSLLNTIDFGHENSFAGITRHRISDATNGSFALTSRSNDFGPDNTATFASLNHQIGNISLFGQHSLTRDTALGNGNRLNLGIFGQKDGWNGVAEYSQVSPQYLPRLGFAPERNFKGYNFSVAKSSTFSKGAIMETEFGANYRTYSTYDTNAHYRRAADLNSSLTFRNGIDLDMAFGFEKFFDSHDRYVFLSAEFPRGDSYRHVQFDAVFANFAGQPYRSLGGQVAYRPLWNWQLTFEMQSVHHFDRNVQHILGTVYDIGKDMSISGRVVREDDNINAYLAFRKSGERGAEYYVILGDPNAKRSRAALVLKAVFPLEIRF